MEKEGEGSLFTDMQKNGHDCKKQSGAKHGEMGPFQFMPSTWLVYGQDGNGDGLSNPWDMEDAAHTAAYYLKRYGYKKGDFARIKRRSPFIIRARPILILLRGMRHFWAGY